MAVGSLPLFSTELPKKTVDHAQPNDDVEMLETRGKRPLTPDEGDNTQGPLKRFKGPTCDKTDKTLAQEISSNVLKQDCINVIWRFIRPSELTVKEIRSCVRFAFVNKICLSEGQKFLESYRLLRMAIVRDVPIEGRSRFLHEVLSPGFVSYVGYGAQYSGPIAPCIIEIVKDIMRLAPQSLHYYLDSGIYQFKPHTIACLNNQVPVNVIEFLFKQIVNQDYKLTVSRELEINFSAILSRFYTDEQLDLRQPVWMSLAAKAWGWTDERRFFSIQNLLNENGFPKIEWCLTKEI